MPDTTKQDAIYLKTSEVASIFNRTPETIRMWCRAGKLPHRRHLGHLYFLREEIDTVIQSMPGLALRGGPKVGEDTEEVVGEPSA